jgi:ribonuclease P protein component
LIERIHGRATFRRFGPEARRIRSGPLTVVVADRQDGRAAVAYAVSRRVGPAVVRNRLRRQLRAAIRSIDLAAPVDPGWYLVVVHPSARGRTYGELADALRRALADAGARP